DDGFLLLPRDLTGRTILVAMRHGISRVDSKTHRVGRRLPNLLDPEQGVARADAVGAAFARMAGLVRQQLEFLRLTNYLDPHTFLHFASRSPNTTQLFERVVAALLPGEQSTPRPEIPHALEAEDYGWATGVEKEQEAEAAAQVVGVEVRTVKILLET